MTAPENVKLGKLPPDPKKPKLKLRSFINVKEVPPPPPEERDWMSRVTTWPMYNNDRVGCCTCAAQGHALGALSTYGSGHDIWVTDEDIIKAYSEISGYNPDTGENDNGAYVQDALNHWRKVGLGDGNKILAFAAVNPQDQEEVDAAINLFGTLILGVALPITAQNQTGPDKVWDFVEGAGGSERYSWGGHCVAAGAYDRTADRIRVTTWGDTQEMTEKFWNTYVDEAWVVITEEWFNAQGTTPGGVNVAALGEGFTALTGEPNPFPEPPPTPDPDPNQPPVVDPPPPLDPPNPGDSADVVLAAAAHAWMLKHHRGTNRIFEGFVRRWLEVKGL